MSDRIQGSGEAKVLVVSPDASLQASLEEVVRAAGVHLIAALREYPNPGTLRDTTGASVVLVDLATDNERALAAVTMLSRAHAVIGVFRGQPDAGLLLRAVRSGAREFLHPPFDPAALRETFARVAGGRAEAAGAPGRITCLWPGKPSSGASTLAAHLAATFSRQNQAPALLVDADPFHPALAFLLKQQPQYTFADAVRDWRRMDPELWHHLITPCQDLHLLPAPEGPEELVLAGPSATAMAAFWRAQYRWTLIDTGGIGHPLPVLLAAHADEVLLVTSTDLCALHATRRSIEILERAGIERNRIRPVLVLRPSGCGLATAEAETALRLPAAATLPFEPLEVHQATMSGVPVAPATAYGRAARPLQPVSAVPVEPARTGWFQKPRLFGRKDKSVSP